ncbi:hypothetical protein [Stutzerimonas balearica]|uniref:hypothetical protein n=1 Tax=Stutzerimonas balearica TaxID=74829 RepID=UPI0028B0B081|nr:hypothetical protein [Stutzerimonas balearica]
MLFVIGALLIANALLVLLLIEGKKARSRIEATLEASVARQKTLLREHRDEVEVIEQQHLEKLTAIE